MDDSVEKRLEAVHAEIEAACRRSGRDPGDVALVAVSKRQPIGRLEEAVAAGQRILGENQVQEAEEKVAQVPGVEWHLIGPLQSNKIARAARIFDVVHSLDRRKVARLLDKEAAKLGRRLEVFVQVKLGAEESKHGFEPERFETEVRPLAEYEALRIVGLMTIPPFDEDPEKARRWFRQLRQLRDQAAAWPDWQDFRGQLSMGMSHDYEVAIEEGATHVRVGTAIFGPRPE